MKLYPLLITRARNHTVRWGNARPARPGGVWERLGAVHDLVAFTLVRPPSTMLYLNRLTPHQRGRLIDVWVRDRLMSRTAGGWCRVQWGKRNGLHLHGVIDRAGAERLAADLALGDFHFTELHDAPGWARYCTRNASAYRNGRPTPELVLRAHDAQYIRDLTRAWATGHIRLPVMCWTWGLPGGEDPARWAKVGNLTTRARKIGLKLPPPSWARNVGPSPLGIVALRLAVSAGVLARPTRWARILAARRAGAAQEAPRRQLPTDSRPTLPEAPHGADRRLGGTPRAGPE